jgi:hypothetical protein
MTAETDGRITTTPVMVRDTTSGTLSVVIDDNKVRVSRSVITPASAGVITPASV